MENQFFTGSICLTDIPKELIKKANNGKLYLNISVSTKTKKQEDGTYLVQPDQYDNTHSISCRPKKEEVKKGINYFIGDLKLHQAQPKPSAEDIQNAPAISQEEAEDLPF